MKFEKRRKGSGVPGPLLIILAAAIFCAFLQPKMKENLPKWISAPAVEQELDFAAAPTDESANPDAGPAAALTIHYIDVGKCNCVLIRSEDGRAMIIDAGANDAEGAEKILAYLRQEGVERLEYLVLTHPHMDHIYAAPWILRELEVEQVLMGDYDSDIVGTKTYQRLLAALEEKDPLVTCPAAGETYGLGNASFTILVHDDSPETAREEMNDCSIALMVTDGLHRFLFYGDGEARVENAMLDSGADLWADVLMVSHHGSASSTGQKLLEAVDPKIAVIPCGLDFEGEQQDPSEKVLNRLAACDAQVYRADENGTVVIYSEKERLRVECEREVQVLLYSP